MNLRDLHYLVTVADCGQFAKAARLCNVSQPSLSIQLKKLEEELGVMLFERTNRRVMVTAAGAVVIARARAALQEVNEMKRLAARFAGSDMEFRLGIIPTVAPYLLPHSMPLIRKRLPVLKLHLVEAQTAQLDSMLEHGTIDGMVIALPLAHDHFETAPLYTERCFFALPAGHRLAKRASLTSADLADEALLLLDEGHCLRHHALDLCASAGMQANTNYRATSLETLRQMVVAGAGVTIMPESAMRAQAGIAYVPCRKPDISRSIGLAWRPSTPYAQIITILTQALSNPKMLATV